MNSFQLEKCRLRSKRANDVFQGLLSVKKNISRNGGLVGIDWADVFSGYLHPFRVSLVQFFVFFLHFLLVLSVSLAFVSYICAEIIIKCHYLNLARAMLSSVRGSVHNNDCNLLP